MNTPIPWLSVPRTAHLRALQLQVSMKATQGLGV